MRNYVLKKICDCTIEQQMRILTIRNSQSVRKSMYTEHTIGVNEHLQWIDGLKADSQRQIFVILKNSDLAVGVVGLSQIDFLHKKCDWAFYLDIEERGGVGSALELFMIDYVFGALGIEKLNCEVLESNQLVVEMHKKFGFCEEGFRRQNIEKNRSRIGVHLLGLVKSDWQLISENVRGDIAHKVKDIVIQINDEEKSSTSNILDSIKNARAKNNINWMGLLKLSLENTPEQSIPIITEIMVTDSEINNLTIKLLEK